MKYSKPIASSVFDALTVLSVFSYLMGLIHGPDFFRAFTLMLLFFIFCFKNSFEKSNTAVFFRKLTPFFLSSRGRWSFFLVCFLVTTFTNLMQALSLDFSQWDVGIYHQIVWSLSTGNDFHSTISEAGNFLWDHLSLSLWILVPFYWLFEGSPLILPFFDAVFAYTGIAAWVYLASCFPGATPKQRSLLSLAVIVFAFFFKSFWGNFRWGFHVNIIYFMCVSWALVLLIVSDGSWKWDKKGVLKRMGVLFLFLLGAFSKEIVLLDTAIGFMVWSALEILQFKRLKKKISTRAIVFSASLIVMSGLLVYVFLYFQSIPRPQIKNYYLKYYAYLGSNTSEFLQTVFLHPLKIVERIGLKELLYYFLIVLSPWLFLPVIGLFKKNNIKGYFSSAWMLMILPSFGSAALADFWPLRHPSYQYVFELWCVLGIICIGWLSQLKSKKWIYIWVIATIFQSHMDPIKALKGYWNKASDFNEVRILISQIPENDSIISSPFIGPWAASRLWIESYPTRKFIPTPCPDWFIESPIDPARASDDSCLKSTKYEMKYNQKRWKIFHKIKKENL